MLESGKKSLVSKIDKKKAAIISAVIVVFALVIWRFWSLAMVGSDVDNAAQGPSAGAASTIIKDTGFNGKKENTDDPAAIRAYCDDLSLAAKNGGGGKIRDLCILDEVVKTYLPSLTDAEIAKLAETDPTCLETGYGKDGFNCFTNFDKNGCDRSGFDQNGNKCETFQNKRQDDAQQLTTLVPENICDLVSGCQSEAEFDINGFNRFGCNRQGKNAEGDMCPAEYITRIYDDNDRDQLGFDKQGFNKFNCDARGLRKDGSQCSLSETTRLFNKNGVDQFGFSPKNVNIHGCDIRGLDSQGRVCDVRDITRKIDPVTGLDQFGLDSEGYNDKNCNLEGLNRSGELCSLEDTPRIFGKDGLDQFGLRKNNRNKFNCSLDGLKPNGDVCKEDELTLRFDPKTGKDQFGRYPNGLNDFECNLQGFKPNGELCAPAEMTRIVSEVTGIDENGLDKDGFNDKGCSVYGFDRNNNRCDLKDIPRLVNKKTGLDQFGIGEDGFNEAGCSLEGFNREGELCDLKDIPRVVNPITGLDQLGFGDDGFNRNDCDINGLTRTGELCAISDITRIVDPKTGLDQFGLDPDFFNPETGCNIQGFNRAGVRCDYDDIPKILDKSGVNQLGFKTDGRNSFGCDINGLKEDGSLCSSSEMSASYDEDNMNAFHKDPDGFSRLGFNDLNYNKNNCDINGLRPDGTVCDIDDITSVYDPVTKLDQFGLDSDGFNEHNCNLKGFDRQGNRCAEDLIPRIFGKDMKDQFGNHISELPESVWLKQQSDKDSLSPLLDENGNQVFLNGQPVFTDENGLLRDANNVLIKDELGKPMKLGFNGEVTDSRGRVVSFEDASGNAVEGTLTSKSIELSPLLDQDGNPVMVNGKPAMVDAFGNVRDESGELITDSSGGAIKLQDDGSLKDSLGRSVESFTLSGQAVDGPLHTETKGLIPVVDENGEQVFIDGKPVFRDENGVLKTADNKVLRDSNNGLLSLGNDGKIRDSLGSEVPITNRSGRLIDSPVSAIGFGLEPLLDANGDPVMINGEPAFVDKDGVVRDREGDIIRGSQGEPLTLTTDGLVVDGDGNVIAASKMGSRSVSSVSAENTDRAPVLDENGRQVYIDGKPVWADKSGRLFDANNNPLLGEDGTQLQLNDKGDVVDSSGNKAKVTDRTGVLVKGPLNSAGSGLAPLVNADGEPLMIDGKPAFIGKDGVVRSANGDVLLDEQGGLLKLSNGQIVDSLGNKVETFTLDGKKNLKGVESISVADESALVPLLDEDGNQIYLDGKPLFLDKNGQVKFNDGSAAKDSLGKTVSLSEGKILNSEGSVADVRTSNGERVTGKVGAPFGELGLQPLLDENGRQVFVDGKPVFADEQGRLKFENGELAKDANGSLLSLENGEVVNEQGRKVATFTNTGEKSSGSLEVAKPKSANVKPLLDKDGNQVFVDGKPAYVDENGVVRDASGDVIKDEFGNDLTFSNGEVRKSNGEKVALRTADGELVTGEITTARVVEALLDENGEPVYIDGKPVYVDKNGVVTDANGNIITGQDGKPMTFDGSSIVDSKGRKVTPTDSEGNMVQSPLSAASSLNKPLLDENGEQLYFNGKKAFVGKDGVIRDENNQPIRDKDGNLVTLNSDGTLTNSEGKVVSAETKSGEKVSGPLRAGDKGAAAVLSETGKEIFVDGQKAFVGDDGLVRNDRGELILGEDGQPLKFENGRIVDSNGNPVKVEDSLGREINEKLYSGIDEIEPLMSADGKKVFVNGQEASVDSMGRLRGPDGELLRDEFGGVITLNKDGELVNSKGDFVSSYDENGKLNTGPLHTSDSGVAPLLSAEGERVKVNGKEAFVRADGVITDENGEPILDESGKPLKMGVDGVVRDSLGNPVDVTTLAGEKVSGPLHTSTQGLSPLLNANGEPVYVDGEPVFVDANGNVKDKNGNIFKTKDGSVVQLDENGRLIDERGRKVTVRDRFGNEVDSPLSAANAGLKPLLDENGEQVLVNGKPAFVGDDGIVRGFDGKEILDGDSLLRLNANGEIVDDEGNVVKATRASKKTNSSLYSKDASKATMKPVLNSDGELMYINGKPVFLDKDGNLVDENNVPFKDEKGSVLSLNENGQVVNELGEVQPNSLLKNSKGISSTMPLVEGKPLTKTEISAKKAAEALSAEERQLLGLGDDGYNANGCSLEGLNRNGELCNIKDVPRLIDKSTGLDQFGLGEDYYNIYGCSLEGLDRNGNKCRDEYVTSIYGEDGFDHRSQNKAGLNRAGLAPGAVDIMGCDAAGANCAEEKSPQLLDSAGVNQFGIAQNGRGRLNLVDGRNEFGCDVNGLDASGNRCEFSKIPRFVNSEGVDQFGLNEQGYNKFECNLEGRKPDGTLCALNEIPRIFDKEQKDQFGLSLDGRNEFGCDLLGYKEDGSRCELSEITRVVGKNGLDQLGLGSDDLNSNGCGIDGLREDGSICDLADMPRIVNPITGFDQFGLDEDGFNDKSCNLQGLNREGELCAPEDIPRIYDANGVDQLGYKKDGRNEFGCDFYGYKEDGSLCSASELSRVFDSKNQDQYGADKDTGRNSDGCDLNGLKPNGKRCKPKSTIRFVNSKGVDQFGFAKSGLNENGCDINGLNESGERCKPEDVTSIIDEETGLNQIGFKEDWTNEYGCSVSGLKEDGTPCDVKNLTSWFDGEKKDQFGLGEDGFNDSECNLLGYRKDGTRCDYENIPKIVGTHGFDQFEIGRDGFNVNNEDYDGFDRNGCNSMNRNRDGDACAKYKDLGLTVADGSYMEQKRQHMIKWAADIKAKREKSFEAPGIAAGTYKASEDALFKEEPTPVYTRVENNSSTNVQIGEVSDNIGGEDTVSQNSNLEKVNIPIGYMAGIYVEQPINSDYTQDVYAKFTTGELAGATLRGRAVVPYVDDPVMPRDKFYYEFDVLVYKRQSIPISAISINIGNDSGMVDADDVDYHRLQRYGGLVVAAAVQALDASFLDSQAERDAQAQADAIGDAANTAIVYGQNTRNLTKQNMQVATEYVSDLAKQQFFRRPTIKKNGGPQMIIFREEVKDERLPMVVSGLE